MKIARDQSAAGPERLGIVTVLAGRQLLVDVAKAAAARGGPYILTADEVADPKSLVLWLKVNGELRQHSDCRDLIFGFEEMVAFWSRVGLIPGDMISTGTPEGVALHHKPDPRAWYLKPGDRVEAGVDGIGVLETFIV